MVSKSFILAGRAVFSVEIPEKHRVEGKQAHYTYRVDRVEATERWPESYFVKVLTGPDNTADYTYLGKLDDFTGQVRTTQASKNFENSYRLKILNRILARVWADDHAAYEQFGFRVHHEGSCGRCGRTLTVPESVESGIGPECTKILAGE